MTSVAFAPSTQELVLGRYRPMRPLGSGGSGSVWLALDERNGLDVALKIIPREGKAAARAEREALAARRLRHDRCVRAYDVGHDASHVYIAYEYIPGRTFREALRTGSLSDQGAVEVAAQVLDALAHAHRAGIVHRDVKPSNILLEDRDEVVVRLEGTTERARVVFAALEPVRVVRFAAEAAGATEARPVHRDHRSDPGGG